MGLNFLVNSPSPSPYLNARATPCHDANPVSCRFSVWLFICLSHKLFDDIVLKKPRPDSFASLVASVHHGMSSNWY